MFFSVRKSRFGLFVFINCKTTYIHTYIHIATYIHTHVYVNIVSFSFRLYLVIGRFSAVTPCSTLSKFLLIYLPFPLLIYLSIYLSIYLFRSFCLWTFLLMLFLINLSHSVLHFMQQFISIIHFVFFFLIFPITALIDIINLNHIPTAFCLLFTKTDFYISQVRQKDQINRILELS